MEQCQQPQRGTDQHHRVENEDAEGHSKIAFLRAEEDIWFSTAAIIVLFHLRIGDQIGDFLVHIKLVGCDGTDRVFELRAVERLSAVENAIDYPKISIEFAR